MYSRTKRKIYLSCMLSLMLASGFSFADYQDQANGCHITRCFINPQVPIATPECRTSVNNLFKQRVRNAPQCPESESSGTYVKIRNDHYPLCPAGLIDSRKVPYAGTGFVIQKDQKLTVKSVSASYNNPAKQAWQPQTAQNAALACISQSAPIVSDFCLDGDEAKSKSGAGCQRKVTVRRYDRVERVPYKVSPIIADVYINRQLWRSYRIYEKDVELEFGK